MFVIADLKRSYTQNFKACLGPTLIHSFQVVHQLFASNLKINTDFRRQPGSQFTKLTTSGGLCKSGISPLHNNLKRSLAPYFFGSNILLHCSLRYETTFPKYAKHLAEKMFKHLGREYGTSSVCELNDEKHFLTSLLS